MSKKGFEFSFAWMFSLIVGAVILFLAIYASTKIIGTERYKKDTITATQLSIIFEPMETGLASGKSNLAVLREETRIYDECREKGNFGNQLISLSTKSGIGKEWQEPGEKISIPNKYIFSEDIEQGKEVYFFSKPFEMPWKISEIIFFTAKKYCFENAPKNIEEEVLGLNLKNVKISNCSSQDIKVCFGSGNCEIKVSGGCSDYNCESEYDSGIVSKNNKQVYYSGSLLYAAIFSSKKIYECNVKRLMKRAVQQAMIFKEESGFLIDKCSALQSTSLLQLMILLDNFDKSEDLLLIQQSAKEINEENEAAECSLW